MNRNLDGIYFRVERNNKWENICFSDLTREEMEKVLDGKSIDFVKGVAYRLGEVLRQIGDELLILQ